MKRFAGFFLLICLVSVVAGCASSASSPMQSSSPTPTSTIALAPVSTHTATPIQDNPVSPQITPYAPSQVTVAPPTAQKFFDPQSGLYFNSQAELSAYQTAHPVQPPPLSKPSISKSEAVALQGFQTTISGWLLLTMDLADFVERVDNGQVDDEQAETELQQFLIKAKKSVQLVSELGTLPAVSADFQSLKNMAVNTQSAIETYLDALEDDDEELEEQARDLLEGVFDYAESIIDEIKQ